MEAAAGDSLLIDDRPNQAFRTAAAGPPIKSGEASPGLAKPVRCT